MTTTSWQVSGQYYETCSCDFVCPCLPGQMAVSPTKGSCTFAMAFQIDRGSYGTVSLDGLGFIVLGLTPEAMGKGNWSVGVIADERASAEQRDAITAIASGAAGGPMAALSGLVGKFLGVESAPIRFDRNGAKWSVKAANLVDMAAEGRHGHRIRTRPSRCISTTPAIRRRIVSRWRTRRRATSTRSVSRGTTRAERTTDSTRRFPGGVRSPLAGRRSLRFPAATASSSLPASFSSPRSPGRISFISIVRCRRPWSTTR